MDAVLGGHRYAAVATTVLRGTIVDQDDALWPVSIDCKVVPGLGCHISPHLEAPSSVDLLSQTPTNRHINSFDMVLGTLPAPGDTVAFTACADADL